jgi:hypothetical protein
MQGVGTTGCSGFAASQNLWVHADQSPLRRWADVLHSQCSLGVFQPYSLYVPLKVPPASGYGLISDLHGGGTTTSATRTVTAERTVGLTESGTGYLMFITEGRGGRY